MEMPNHMIDSNNTSCPTSKLSLENQNLPKPSEIIEIHSFNSLLMKRCFKVAIICGVFYSPWHPRLPDETSRENETNENVANKEKSNKEREQRRESRGKVRQTSHTELRGDGREQQSEQNKRRISASSVSSVTHQAAPLKRELTTDNQLAGGRPNFHRRAAEIKHLICTEVNNHILYGAITWSNGRGGSVETCSYRTDFTASVGPLLLSNISSNAFMLIGDGMTYGFDTKNTHAFKIVKLLEIPLALCWAGDNVRNFIWVTWKSQPTYGYRALLGPLCP